MKTQVWIVLCVCTVCVCFEVPYMAYTVTKREFILFMTHVHLLRLDILGETAPFCSIITSPIVLLSHV